MLITHNDVSSHQELQINPMYSLGLHYYTYIPQSRVSSVVYGLKVTFTICLKPTTMYHHLELQTNPKYSLGLHYYIPQSRVISSIPVVDNVYDMFMTQNDVS